MTRIRASCASSPVRATWRAETGIVYFLSSAEAHQLRAAFVDVARGGDELAAHGEKALCVDHVDQHLGGIDVGLLEAAGLDRGLVVARQHPAAFHTKQAVQALGDWTALPSGELDSAKLLRRL